MQTEVQEFTVRDRLGDLTVKGRMLADCRYGRMDKPRWTDMALYQVVDPDSEYRYALEYVARSFVYHRADGPCARKGHRITTVSEVRASEHRWRWLFPCRKPGCRPGELESMNDNDRIAEEKDNPHLYVCRDAPDILKRLYQHSGEISELAVKLLTQAAQKDPAIARAWRNTTRRV